MKVSVAWLQEFTDVDVSIEELVELIGSRLVEVEEVIDWGARFKGVIIGRITKVMPHENADKLKVYEVAIGNDSTCQVVSGDTTLEEGDKVGYIAPGVTVPSTVDSAAPMVLKEVSLRGVSSQGMLGSGRELCLNDEHTKVRVLDTDAEPGTPFASAYNLDDVILDIENKSFTHRPDCFGLLGVAREIAAIQDKQFTSPSWFQGDGIVVNNHEGNLPLKVDNQIPELVPRFTAITLQDVSTKSSSLMLQSMLTRLGVRPINNIVDITNYLMLLSGQPLHAYDYDKVRALDKENDTPVLTIRHPKKGEKITLLDGREITPHPDTMMVAAGTQLVCVGGMIGGSNAEVSATTKNIILEAANWDMYAIRRTSMQHGIFTEAVTRFAKGQSPSQTAPVLGHALGMLLEASPAAKIGAPLIDIYPEPKLSPVINCNAGWINHLLGTELETPAIIALLRHIECEVNADGGDLQVTPPLWRQDLALPEDIAEEVGRLRGFDAIEPTLPLRSVNPAMPHPLMQVKQTARQFLRDAGANETLTYAFISDRLLRQTAQQTEDAYHLANSLSPELAYFRTNLLGSLLAKVHPNHKAGFPSFALFEIGKTQHQGELDQENLPVEHPVLSFVLSAETKAYNMKAQGAPYYHARHYINELLTRAGVKDVRYRLVRPHTVDSVPKWLRMRVGMFDLNRSALIVRDSQMLGIVGEPAASVRKALKLPAAVGMFEVHLEEIAKSRSMDSSYQPLPRFPGTSQDLCFKVATDLPYEDLILATTDFLEHQEHILFSIEPVDIFRRQGETSHKQITIRLHLHHQQKTLETKEVNALLDHLSSRIEGVLKAQRV